MENTDPIIIPIIWPDVLHVDTWPTLFLYKINVNCRQLIQQLNAINNTYFFSIVRAQPSMAISCMAAKEFVMRKMYTNAITFGFPISGNNCSILVAV